LPAHAFDIGVTVRTVLIGTRKLFVAVNDAIGPAPDKGNPIFGLLFVQLNCVPTILKSVKLILPVGCPPHKLRLATGSTVGKGLMVIEKVIGFPEHVLETGTTVKMAVTGVLPKLTAENEAIFPVPLSGKDPKGTLVLVQL
jgi:hypothetical protein